MVKPTCTFETRYRIAVYVCNTFEKGTDQQYTCATLLKEKKVYDEKQPLGRYTLLDHDAV